MQLSSPHTPHTHSHQGFLPMAGMEVGSGNPDDLARVGSPQGRLSSSVLLEEEAGLCCRRGGGHRDILRKPFVVSQGSSASRVLEEQPGVSGHISGKNAPIVTGRGNSCLLSVMFGGMFGLKEMR